MNFQQAIKRATEIKRQAQEAGLDPMVVAALVLADAIQAHADQLDNRLERIERSLDAIGGAS